MHRRRHNLQFFALRQSPARTIELAGRTYTLVRVFKHDFWAATCLYEAGGAVAPSRVVVKYGRTQDFAGLPLAWVGQMTRRHEELIYAAIAGIRGVPRWVGAIGERGYVIEYIDGVPLDHVEAAPEGFFDRLREIFDALHARGVAYCDGNKRSNILIGPDGRPYLVDYQIAVRRRDDLPWPLRAMNRAAVQYLAGRDLYHLYKHKRRISPHELTPEQDALAQRLDVFHRMHRRLAKPYRALRRRFLRKRYQAGRLVSPTAELEDHHQPEKASWRQK